MVLPLLSDVVSPLHLDSPTILFPETSVSVLRAIVSLFYEGIVITSQQITAEVLRTLKNLGFDPDRFTKVQVWLIISKLIPLLSLFRSSSPSRSQG